LFAAFLVNFSPVGCAQDGAAQSQKADFATLSAKADAAREVDRLDEAARLYRRALVLRSSWAEGWWSLATLEYDRDHYSQAASAFKKVIALQPNNGTAQAMLGLCEFELGQDEAALRHIQKGKGLGLQKNPELWHVILFHEGILLQRKGSFQAAQDTLEELCLQTDSNDKAAMILGMTMLRQTAKELPVPGSKDDHIILLVGRAQCLAGQKKYDRARPDFESVVDQYPEYPNIHYAFGLFLFEIRDVREGVEQMKQDIANNPRNVMARLRIAAAEYKQDSAAGLPYAKEAVELDPDQPFAHMLLGLLRLDVDDYLNAIPELEIARKGLPREPKIYAALGTAYSRAGRKREATQARLTFARITQEEKRKSSAGRTPEPRNPHPEQITIGDLPPSSK
jgi:tetratricopeptide (TPR) repeat protein